MVHAPLQPGHPDAPSGRHHTILVVGPHLATLTMIEEALSLEGYDVVVTLASRAWIEQAIAQGLSQAAILDVGYITDATATDFLSLLWSCCEASDGRMPPVILLTANPHLPRLAPCPTLLKPFHLKDLYHTLAQVRDGNHHLSLAENSTGRDENEGALDKQHGQMAERP